MRELISFSVNRILTSTPTPQAWLPLVKQFIAFCYFSFWFCFSVTTSTASSGMAGATEAILPWRKNPHRSITVEITIFLYIAGYALEVPVMQQYLYERAKEFLQVNGTENVSTICNPSYNVNNSEYR